MGFLVTRGILSNWSWITASSSNFIMSRNSSCCQSSSDLSGRRRVSGTGTFLTNVAGSLVEVRTQTQTDLQEGTRCRARDYFNNLQKRCRAGLEHTPAINGAIFHFKTRSLFVPTTILAPFLQIRRKGASFKISFSITGPSFMKETR